MRNPIQLLKDSSNIFFGNPFLFIGIVAVPMILSVIATLFEPIQDTAVVSVFDWMLFGLLMLVTSVVNIFMGAALVLAIDNPNLTISSAYGKAKGFFWRYIGLSILMTVVLTIAYLLLIIPGIILSVWFLFAAFVLILENTPIIDSMRRSREYVKGKWWGVFGRSIAGSVIIFLLMIVVMGIAAILPGGEMTINITATAISMLVAPIMVGYMYLMYKDSKGGNVVVDSTFTPNTAE